VGFENDPLEAGFSSHDPAFLSGREEGAGFPWGRRVQPDSRKTEPEKF